jgi:hypothetical protein
LKFTDVSDVLNAFIISLTIIVLKTEAAITSETSVKFCQFTWRNISEDSHLRTHRRENLKSQNEKYIFTDIKFKFVRGQRANAHDVCACGDGRLSFPRSFRFLGLAAL